MNKGTDYGLFKFTVPAFGEDFAWQSLIYPEALIWFYPVGYLAFLPSYSASKLQISLSIRDSEW